MLTLLLMFFILYWPAVLMLRPRQRGHHECPACGYSLVGNVSGICSECGEPRGTTARPMDDARLRAWLIGGVVLLLAGMAVNGSFILTYLHYILHPHTSPHGHENAFGDAGEPFNSWCLTWPFLLCAASAAATCIGCGRARRAGASTGRLPLFIWGGQVLFMLYLGYIHFAWFFD